MKTSAMTAHARLRTQQRGINDIQVELIRLFGVDHYQKGGCSLSFIPEKTLVQLRRAIDKLSQIAMVKAPSEQVVTLMHMSRKIRTTAYSS